MLVVSETWLNSNVPSHCIVPPNYRMFRWDRDTRGGGVAIIVKQHIDVLMIECSIPETVWCKITYANTVYLLGAVYRPPATAPEFLDKLNDFLCNHLDRNTRLIMTGDFNLPNINWDSLLPGHVEISSSEKLLQIMISHNLKQIVKENTRVTPESRSLLDLVFLSNKIGDYTVSVEDGLSDHKMVLVRIVTSASTRPQPSIPVQVKDYSRADDTSILDFLELSFDQFKFVCDCESVDEL